MLVQGFIGCLCVRVCVRLFLFVCVCMCVRVCVFGVVQTLVTFSGRSGVHRGSVGRESTPNRCRKQHKVRWWVRGLENWPIRGVR
jgi:hypothetical protein